MKRLIFAVLLVVWGEPQIYAQRPDAALQDKLQNLLEQVIEEDENADVEQLLSELFPLLEHPIEINRANAEDLAPLFFLSPLQIEALLSYRTQYGSILSVFELAQIEGFSRELAELTAMFMRFKQDEILVSRRIRQELLVRGTRLLEIPEGFKNGNFEGSPDKLYTRYRYQSSGVKIGLTAEKDAGESFFRQSNPEGFDYYSGFLSHRLGKKGSAAVIGDYVVQWGQGVTVWQGFAMGKSTDVDRIARFSQGVKPCSSTDENNFMRGAAVDLDFGKFRLQSFLSAKKFDANTDSLSGERIFTSFQTSGLHRTTSEIDDKQSVRAVVGGAHLGFQGGKLGLGVSATQTHYQFPLQRADALYNQYLFDGQNVVNCGVDYRLVFNKLYFFGELAGSTGGWASVNGLMFQPVGQVAFSALCRNFNRGYNAPFAAAFAENSRVNDEQGLFLGIKVLPAAKIAVRAYADFFQYKWVKYTTAAPGRGHEFMVRADYDLSTVWQIYTRYFFERKPVKYSGEQVRYDLDQIRQSVRLQLDGDLGQWLSVRTRFEQSFYEHDHRSTGFMVSQDLALHSADERLKFWLRMAYFNTDDYDSRIYAYENDLLYQFSIPAFYDKGIRSYVNGKVKICEKIEFWIKWSKTWFLGVKALGSGNTAIDGSTRTELKFQLRFKM